ncbi:MAG: pilus assembly protein, partial [Candidatus Omnitrophica bacterium]|nr:pilus assembly protein [Candidatus Omnitrophota bacterium]
INKMNKFFEEPLTKEKGQALAEFAIFGAVLLFCLAMLLQYALEANYQQQTLMEGFRKTQKLAFNRSGLGANTSLTLVKNKGIPDPRDQWGFAERYPVVGGGSVTWDNNAGAQYIKEYGEEPDRNDLPAQYFEVEKGDTAGAFNKGAHRPSAGSLSTEAFGFYNATYKRVSCSGSVTVVFEDPDHTKGKDEYYTESVSCADIRVMKLDPADFGQEGNVDTNYKLMYPYFRDAGNLKRRIIWADLDGDGKLEQIIAANASKEFLCIVYHGGRDSGVQIDTDYVNAAAAPYGNALTPQDKQGLIPDFNKVIQHRGSSIVRTQENGNITSRTTLSATQTITHKFRLNNGQVVEIPVQVTPDSSQTYNWR